MFWRDHGEPESPWHSTCGVRRRAEEHSALIGCELVAEGRIIPASAVDLAQVQLGVAVRAGAPKPDISTVEALRHLLLRAKTVNALTTIGLYVIDKLLPNLGIAGEVTGKIKEGIVATVATGEVEIAGWTLRVRSVK